MKGDKNPNYKKDFSPETRAKLSESHRGKFGEKSSNWKGGKTSVNDLIRGSEKYFKWRLSIFQRDFFTCGICKGVGGRLNVHHIKSLASILKENYIKTFEAAMKCPDIWNLNNGITCCEKCHKKTKTYGKYHGV